MTDNVQKFSDYVQSVMVEGQRNSHLIGCANKAKYWEIPLEQAIGIIQSYYGDDWNDAEDRNFRNSWEKVKCNTTYSEHEYHQQINWVQRIEDAKDKSANNKVDIDNAKKALKMLYPNGEKFYICTGKKDDAGNLIPNTNAIQGYTIDTMTDDVLNTIYYQTNGAYLQLNTVDDDALAEAKSKKKSAGICKKNIIGYKYFYIEADPEGDADYNEFIKVQKEKLTSIDLPWICMTFSGQKSIHTVIRLDAEDEKDFEFRLSKIWKYLELKKYKYDPKVRPITQWTRFFCSGRKLNTQHILAINDNPVDFETWYKRHPELQPKKSCNGLFSAGKVDTNAFYDLMQSEGVYRVNDNGKHKAVQTTGKFIKEITIADVSDIFSNYIDASDDELNELENKSLQSFRKGLNETIFRNFKGLKPLIHTDTKDAVYLYFKNGML